MQEKYSIDRIKIEIWEHLIVSIIFWLVGGLSISYGVIGLRDHEQGLFTLIFPLVFLVIGLLFCYLGRRIGKRYLEWKSRL